MAKILGQNENVASPEALAALRERHTHYGEPGHRIAAYQNQALDSAGLGHFVFLIIGPGRALVEAPARAPDGPYGAGWKYQHVGYLDLDKNELEKTDG